MSNNLLTETFSMISTMNNVQQSTNFNKTQLLRWGWIFLERTRILSGIQFTTHFIEIFVVHTKWFISSFVKVILTRQTCGQRSSRAAESKHRARENYFSKWICYMFHMSKSRGDWRCRSVHFSGTCKKRNKAERKNKRGKNVFRPQEKSEFGIAQCFSFRKYPKSAQTYIFSLLYILTWGTYSKFSPEK